MKKLLLLTFFILFNNICFSQAYKWRASVYSTRQSLDQGTTWTTWSPWATSGVLIVAKDQRVNVYSANHQVYDMIENVTKDYDKDSNPIYNVMCVDENGTRCKMVWYHNSKEGSFVIFEFSNLEIMYGVAPLD
jgi:hypothetical protein